MSKKTQIEVAVGVVHHGGTEYCPGERIECSEAEAQWLVSIGVARIPGAPVVVVDERQVLLAAIAGADNPVQLAALMPEEEPDDEIKAAFEAKMAELEK